jgi:hypothetical protein
VPAVLNNVAPDVAIAEARNTHNRANDRKPDLSTMRVSSEQKRDALRQPRKDIGIVRERNQRLAGGNVRNRFAD